MSSGLAQPPADLSAECRQAGVGRGIVAVVAAWLLLVATGMAWLTNYSTTPGAAAQTPAKWPGQSQLKTSNSRSTLVLFAHPQCPCTRASIRELELIMTRCQSSLQAFVLFTQPAGFDREWVESGLWSQAASIPGVTVIADREGREARAFGARTSGQTLLYDPAAALQFRGGITVSRGHSGDNVGRSTVVALVNRQTEAGPRVRDCSVYGCPLFIASE